MVTYGYEHCSLASTLEHARDLSSEWRPDAMHADSSLVRTLPFPRFVSVHV